MKNKKRILEKQNQYYIYNNGKRIKLTEFERISRARKGVQVVRDVKTNPYYILKTFIENSKKNIGLKHKEDIKTRSQTADRVNRSRFCPTLPDHIFRQLSDRAISETVCTPVHYAFHNANQ